MNKFQTFLKRTGLDEKPFQTECFDWCLKREQSISAANISAANIKGGILALEMGLGKTIIMLGLIECNFKRHTLIVLPRALLDQWEKHIQKYFGHNPLVYHGSRHKSLKMSLESIQDRPIVLTTYGQLSMPSLKQIRRGRKISALHKIKWNRLICDEGHHVSHSDTNEFKGVEALRTDIKWLVTGTPIQNNEQELYNLYSLLGLPKSLFYYEEGNNYATTAQDFVFHRTKAGVGIILPPLHEHNKIVQWETEDERQFAEHIHSILACCNVPLTALAAEVKDRENPVGLHLKYMTKSKQVCVYPPMLTIKACFYTSKINALIQTILERQANGCGKIVFCHYYAEIDAVEKRLLTHGFSVAKFDGRVPNGLRQQILSEPVDVLLAQIKMCREGLNLQDNYSEVYFSSPNFNPATEDQAIARCWRIGQKKPVHVFRYIMEEPTGKEEANEVANEEANEVANEEANEEANEVAANAYSMDSYSALLQVEKRKFMDKLAQTHAQQSSNAKHLSK